MNSFQLLVATKICSTTYDMSRQSGCSLAPDLAAEYYDLLKMLCCPYVEGIDESYVEELLFTPGEHRMRFLMWVFSQIHESAEKALSSKFLVSRYPSDIGIDKRVQVLTSLAASIGLCRAADVDLIRGEASAGKHQAFWKNVFAALQFSRRGESDLDYIHTEKLLDQIFKPEANIAMGSISHNVNLLPPNLQREMETVLPREKKSLKSLSIAHTTLEELSKSLGEQQARLEKLEKEAMYTTDNDEIAMSSVCRKLDLTLSDLDQMITTFDQVFTNNYLLYCDKQKEELGDVGHLFEVVKKQFSYVMSILENLNSVQRASDEVSKYLSSWSKTLSEAVGPDPAFVAESTNRLHAISQTLAKQTTESAATSESSHLADTINYMCQI